MNLTNLFPGFSYIHTLASEYAFKSVFFDKD
jgi:hypothetical protein